MPKNVSIQFTDTNRQTLFIKGKAGADVTWEVDSGYVVIKVDGELRGLIAEGAWSAVLTSESNA